MERLDTIIERLERLETENAVLRSRLRELESAAGPSAPTGTDDAAVSRRELLRRTGAAAIAGAVAVAGASSLGGASAAAAGEPLLMAAINDSSGGTVYNCATSSPGLHVYHTGGRTSLVVSTFGGDRTGTALRADAAGSGSAIHAEKLPNFPTGHAVLGEQQATDSTYAAIAGVTAGKGPGLYGRADGRGAGVWGAASAKGAAGVKGTNPTGRGGVFSGRKAPARLLPSSATTHPARGARGDLYVDKGGRLWFCKGGSAWRQLA